MRCYRAVLAFLITALSAIGSVDSAACALIKPYKDGELLVQFRPGLRSAGRAGLERHARVRLSRALGHSGIQHVILEPGASVEQALSIYAQDPEVAFVEPNYWVRAQTAPGDSYFSRQWGLYNNGQAVDGYTGTAGADLDALRAWSISTGSPQVVVAVIDTGCDLNHPDLEANIWANPAEIPGNGIDDDGNHLIDDVHGWDFSDQDSDPQDSSGHGSHVAGIIAAAGDNGRGIAGVAWQAQIMPLRFMNALEEGTISDAIDAIEYALAKGVKIINCSWGSSNYSTSLRYVMSNAEALFICAAGNNATDIDTTPFYPAAFDDGNIISVAASDQMDRLAWFSNFGTVHADVAAPGIRIYSLANGRQTRLEENFNAGWPVAWTTGGSGDTWAVADPPAVSGAPALAVSPSGSYVNNADTWVQVPVQDLSTASSGQLSFRLFGQTEADSDYLFLDVSTNGTDWNTRPLQMGSTIKYSGISGSVPVWTTIKADLGPWDGEPQLFMRLRFKSDSADTRTGYFLDDLRLSAAEAADSYQFMQGTSMAAGYVSGLATLILSENGGLSAQELKSIIVNSVDLSQNLLDEVASGGRVNAFNALTLLRDLSLTATSAAADRILLTWATPAALNSQVLIQRRTDNQADFEIVARVDAGITTYADDSLAAQSTYYYRIQAETQDGRTGFSNQTLATTLEASEASPAGAADAAGGGSGGGCFIVSAMN